MGWSGGQYKKGNYASNGWTGDASLGIGIEAGRHDTQDDDFANGINNCVAKDGTNVMTGSLNLGNNKATNMLAGTAVLDGANVFQVQNTSLSYLGTTGGTSTAFTVTATPTITALTTGARYAFKANAANGAAATLKIDGTAATTMQRQGTALAGNEFKANDIIEVFYDGTNFQIINIAEAPLFVDRTNNRVGVGTTAPAVDVDVQGTATAVSSTRFSADAVGSLQYFRKSRGATVGTNTIVQSGDQVGGFVFQGANGTGYTDAASIIASVDSTPGASADMPGNLVFSTTPDASGTLAERMRITNAGRVGIGTNAPATALEVQGTGGVLVQTTGQTVITGNQFSNDVNGVSYQFYKSRGASVGTNTIVQSGDTVGIMSFYGANGTAYDRCAYIAAIINGVPGASADMPGALVFGTAADGASGGSERMRIANTGFVGIGSNNPAYLLTVSSTTAANTAASFSTGGAGDATTIAAQIIKTDATNTAGGNNFLGFYIAGGATGSGKISSNGASAAAFFTLSDVTLKENIVDLPSQLDNILALRPVEFDYKDGSGHQIGFIAQEVEPIYPENVYTESDGIKSLGDMSRMDARIIKAIQDLNAKVEALEARVAELEG